MITYICGKIVGQTDKTVTICAGIGGNLGVGYEVVYGDGEGPIVGELTLYTVHAFGRDGQQTLYGYPDPASRRYGIFAEKTPSVGPKSAHTFVTTVGLEAINGFLYQGVAIKTKVPGISAANCAAILETIRRQVEKDGGEGLTAPSGAAKARTRSQVVHELLEGLTKLGFGADFVRPFIGKVIEGQPVESMSSAELGALVFHIAKVARGG